MSVRPNFTKPICRGDFSMGNACGTCEKCQWELNKISIEGDKLVAKIQQDLHKPIDPPILAQAIVDISAAMQKLLKSGINRAGIVVLLQDATGMCKRDIVNVLVSLEDLGKKYTK